MLTNDDIETLMDALDALPKARQMDTVSRGMVRAMLTSDKSDAQQGFSADVEALNAELPALQETIILIKAKLIQLKNKNLADEAAKFLKTNPGDDQTDTSAKKN